MVGSRECVRVPVIFGDYFVCEQHGATSELSEYAIEV
jgi:hypothetical protein